MSNAILGNLNEVINHMVESGVDHEEAAKLLKYCVGGELETRLKVIAGNAVLNKRELDQVGASKNTVKLCRYIWLVLHSVKEV